MSEDPNERLDRLEARVAALEAAIQAQRAGVAPAGQPLESPPVESQPGEFRPGAASSQVLAAIRNLTPPPLPGRAASAGAARAPASVPAGASAGSDPGAAQPALPDEPPPLPQFAETGAGPAAGEAPAATPPRAHTANPARSPAASDFERFVGLAVLGRIGIVAVVLAAAYFAQLGWSQLSPVARVLSIYALSLGMLAAGLWLRPRVAAKYTAFLLGGATALSYLAGVVAEMRYGLLGPVPASGLLLASAGLGQVLARLLRIEAMATVALAGAYAAPVLVGQPSPTPTTFFVFLLALHTWAAFTEHQWNWQWARRLAVVATTLLAVGWLLSNPTPAPLSLVLHVEAILLGLTAPELLAAGRGRALPNARWTLVLAGFWIVHLALLQDTARHGAVAGFGLLAGAAILACGAFLRRQDENRDFAGAFAQLGSIVVVLGAFLCWNSNAEEFAGIWDQPWARMLSMLAVTAALFAIRRSTGVFDAAAGVGGALAALVVLKQVPAAEPRWQAGIALSIPSALLLLGRIPVAPVLGLLLGCALTFFGATRELRFDDQHGLWASIALAATGGFATFAALVGSFRRARVLVAAAAMVLGLLGFVWTGLALFAPPSHGADLTAFVNLRFLSAMVLLGLVELSRRQLPADADDATRTTFAGIAGGIGYLAGLAELLTVVREWPHGWSAVTISLYTLLFAGALLVAGFVRKQSWLRWVGLSGFALVVLKVAVYDLSELATPLRVLVTGVLGLVLLAGSWAYARNRVPQSASR